MEFHHYPFTLYDITYIIYQNRYLDYITDQISSKLNKVINPFDIAKEVMELHYKNKVGLVPLSLTPHELYHKGELFIPLDKKYVFGNYLDILDTYKVNFGSYKDKLKILTEQTKEIMEGHREYNLDVLKIKKSIIKDTNDEEDSDLDEDIFTNIKDILNEE